MLLVENFCFENCIRKSRKKDRRQTKMTFLDSLHVKEPPRIGELPKVIPRTLNKHNVSSTMSFAEAWSSRE